MASTIARRSTSFTCAQPILTLPPCNRSWLMAGSTFSASSSGTLTRTVSPLASELITRTCSQRSCFADVVECVELVLAAGVCARIRPGMRSRVVAAASAVLVQKPRLQSDIAGYLHAGGRPVLEERYEACP